MAKSSRKNLLLASFVQLLVIALACILAYHLTRRVDIIPSAILRLPGVFVSSEDMWAIVRIFCCTFFVQITLTCSIYRSSAFDSPARFGAEYLYFLVAYTSASLYAFLATTINYDAQYIAAIGLLSTALYLLTFAAAMGMRSAEGSLSLLWQGCRAVLGGILSVPGLLVMLYFLLPLFLGMAFTKDRDIANRITQVRIWFNPVPGGEWGFRNFFPELVFEQPMLVLQTPGDPESYYVLERVGRVYRVSPKAGHPPELQLDIGALLGTVEVENGALGMAFHPDFNPASREHQRVFVYYTDTRAESVQVNRISSFDFGLDSIEERLASETPLMVLQRESSGFHNGGSLNFGPDGYLYIALGEGVHPPGGKTSAEVLRGAILRIDVDASTGRGLEIEPFGFGRLTDYRVPADNPFVDNPAVRNEYWALGLRNPYRISFDPESGQLWAGDVGSTVWEEVNRIEAGRHYGYPVVEGREATGKSGSESLGLPMVEPVYTYMHDAYDRAVIGGVVYRGDRYPQLQGQYVFADNYSAKLFAMPIDRDRVDEVTLLARANQYAQRGVSSVTQLSTGEILVTTLGAASEPSGEVLLLVRAEEADNSAPILQSASDGRVEYNEAAAASLFNANCARCHGPEGDGTGPDAEMLGVPLPDFTSPLYHASRSEKEIYQVIAEGGAALGKSPMMPPWQGALTESEIDDLVHYIQALPNKYHKH